MNSDFLDRDFSREFVFKTSRSSGPGGQNVNKVSSKVELRFNLLSSQILTLDEKEILAFKLKKKLNNHGELIIVSQSERSQYKNKQKAISKFYLLIHKALTPEKIRKATKPSTSSKAKRVDTKRIRAGQKSLRRKIDFSE
jgi:ribosome-associated protein